MGFFPVDDKTIEYFQGTGRTTSEIEAFQAYFKAQGLYGVPRAGEIDYTQGRQPRPRHGRAEPGRAEAAAGPDRDRQRQEAVHRRCSASRPPRTASTSRPAHLLTRHHVRAAEARTRRTRDGAPRSRTRPRRRPARRASSTRWPPTSRRWPPRCTKAEPTHSGARRLHDRQRRRADRGDHLVHQHLEPERAARRRPAGEEGGRGRPEGRAAHQDLARARLAHRHRVPDARPACCPTSRSSASASPPTAAPPASATPAT